MLAAVCVLVGCGGDDIGGGGTMDGTGSDTGGTSGTESTSLSVSTTSAQSTGGGSTGFETSTDSTGGTGTTGGGDASCELPADASLALVWELVIDGGVATGANAGPLGLYADGDLLAAGVSGTQGLDGSLWLRRIDPNGELGWNAELVAPPQSGASAVTIAADGTAFVVGSTLVEDPDFGLTSKLFVGAFDSLGAPLWSDDTPTHPPNPFAQGWAAAATPDGGVVVGGPAGNAEGYLRRYDPAGDEVWTVLTTTQPRGLAIGDTDDEIYVAGSDGTGPLLERRDAAGSIVWSEPGPGVGEQDFFEGHAAAVALGSDGSPVFIGLSSFLVGNPMMPTDSWSNFWVQRRAADGSEVWTTEMDHTDYVQMSLAVHDDDAVTTVNRTMSERPRVRHFDDAGALQWEYEVPCMQGWRLAPMDGDLVLAGSIPAGSDDDAFVGRFAVP